MRDKIAGILEGEFDYETGSLEFSCPRIEITLLPDAVSEGSFFLIGKQGRKLDAEVMASGIRMVCTGMEVLEERAEIGYRFDSTGMEAGEVLKGEFKVISSQGENYLPYVATVVPPSFETSLGNIKNLFHFTNLAKTNWNEAVKLFYQPQFLRVFDGNDSQYINVYKGLCTLPASEQRVEEFLLEIRKKQPVEYLPEKEEIALGAVSGVWEEVISLNRNGWGYTRLWVELEGTFLSGEKELLTDDDFLGNLCNYHIQIDEKGLHAGRNFGSVRFYNEYVSLIIPVTVTETADLRRGRRRGRQQKIFELMRFYMEYRRKRISAQSWFQETMHIVDGMQAADEKNVSPRLFQAQLLLTQERYNEAEWVLSHVQARIPLPQENPELYGYYCYLTTLCGENAEYASQVTEEIWRLYEQNSTSWKLAWLLLYLDEEFNRSPSRKWVFLEQQFGRGCNSPVWYMEAVELIRENPALLMKFTPFVEQVLHFAARYELLNDDMIGQIHYLAGRIKEYSPCMYAVLKACYEKKHDSVSLQAVCTLLIKGNKVGAAYREWYREGILHNLRITRLYEYYMMSVDAEDGQEQIPKMALLYFAYHSELDYEKNAYLYAYVVKHREEYPELYATYLGPMEKFLLEQLDKGRANKNLAYLYKNLFAANMLNAQNAEKYARVLFLHRIQVEDKRIRRVVLINGKQKEEEVYPLVKGVAYAPIFTSDHKILLEDGQQNRFSASVSCRLEKLMIPGRMVKRLEGLVKEQTGFLLYLCEGSKNYTVITGENEWCVRILLESEQITESYRQEIAMKLVRFYYEGDNGEKLDELLGRLLPEKLSSKERAEIIRYMVIRGMYDRALDWVERYGAHGVEPKTLVRMCSRILAREDFTENPLLTEVVYYAFSRGKYDENILYYLGRYFKGLTRELRDIWVAAGRFDVECYALCERMLIQMLYTGAYIGEEMEVLKQYLSGGARTEVAQAYLSHCAYLYFVRDKLTEDYVFQELKRLYRSGEDLSVVCQLALLKAFAEKDAWEEDEQDMIGRFAGYLVRKKGLCFPFFKRFTQICPCLHDLTDKTMLEYRTDPDTKVMLHYMLKKERGNSMYHTEEMKNMYGGIFVRSFVLFFGESVQYYIMEEKDGREKLTQSGALHKSDTERENAVSRYSLLNDAAMSFELKDYDTVNSLLEEYLKNDYIAKRIFELI